MRNNTKENTSSPARLEPAAIALINRACNAGAPGTPAWKANALIRDAELSRSLVADWISREMLKARGRGNTLGTGLIHCICGRVSIEALLHRGLGIPVNQVRAASLYEKRLALLHPENPTFEERSRIWDEAVLDHMHVAAERWSRGLQGRPRWLPLADGTSSAPHSKRRQHDSGLAEWEALTRRRDTGATRREVDWNRLRVDRADTGAVAHDAAWFAAHGITRDMIRTLDESTLRELDAVGESPVEHDLTLVLGDPSAARRLIGEHPDMDACAILAKLGMGLRLARAGILFENRRHRNPAANIIDDWNTAAREAGVRAWSDGLAHYRHTVAALRGKACRAEETNAIMELMGA